jgi:hypothetical protein
MDRISAAAARTGRDPAEITLVAVTKTWPAAVVVDAYNVGIRHFGENRPQEHAEKREQVEQMLGPESGIIWHHIGDVQSRKTALVAEHTDFFHALDRLKIARRMSRHCQELGKELPVLLEVNVSGEENKSGFACQRWEEDEQQRKALLAVIREIHELPALALRGLMTMAPWHVPDEEIRAVFRRTRRLAEWLREAFPAVAWDALSMGMTDDFEIAIEEGATHIRVGRALFGERNP